MANADAFRRELEATFPWIAQLDLSPNWFQEVAATSASADEALAQLRQAAPYKARFPGLLRDDGSFRMNEAQYMEREQDFRSLLRQYGYDMSEYQTPASLAGVFESEQDPNEFQSRLQTYKQVSESSDEIKDAFYVYAGEELSDDELYQAAVDPSARVGLERRYAESVASNQFSYQTFINRATQLGLKRVANSLRELQNRGALTGDVVGSIMQIDRQFADRIMDAIYTNGGQGDPSGGSVRHLSLNELLASFEYATVGAAAKGSGLEMPTKERLAEIRAAGVEAEQAARSYAAFGQQRGTLSAAAQRAGIESGLSVETFEDATFFNEGGASQLLQRAAAKEEAAGRSGGSFRFSEGAGGIVQRGLTSRF